MNRKIEFLQKLYNLFEEYGANFDVWSDGQIENEFYFSGLGDGDYLGSPRHLDLCSIDDLLIKAQKE